MKSIIFAGHFTIGEKINNTQLQTIKEALTSESDLAILVNDIDIKRKLKFFDIGGREMVIKHYGSRIKCGTTNPLSQLPEYTELPNIIDWTIFESSLKKIKESSSNIDIILNSQIIPSIIQQRLAEYGLTKKPVLIFTERELRNRASTRLSNSRKNTKKTWVQMLEEIDMIDKLKAKISNIPTCGAIMMALYEKLEELGYQRLTQLYSDDDKEAVENAREICEVLHKHYPTDKRWSIEIINHFFN